MKRGRMPSLGALQRRLSSDTALLRLSDGLLVSDLRHAYGLPWTRARSLVVRAREAARRRA